MARKRFSDEDILKLLRQIELDLSTGRYPKSIRADNGPYFISRDLDLWAYTKNVTLVFSRLG